MSVTLAFFYFLSFNLFVFDTLDFTVIIACAVQSVLKCSFPKIHNKTILHLLWNIRLVNVKSMYLTLESLERKHSAFATFGSIYCSRHLSDLRARLYRAKCWLSVLDASPPSGLIWARCRRLVASTGCMWCVLSPGRWRAGGHFCFSCQKGSGF